MKRVNIIMLPYKILKAAHLISIICWMAGLLYLPRLFVYHTNAQKGDKTDKIFQTMERKLLRYIMIPSLIASLITGLGLIHVRQSQFSILFISKLILAFLLMVFQWYMGLYRRKFARHQNNKSENFFRFINEIPSVIMIFIIIIVIFK